MDLRAITPADYQAVRELLAENGWEKRVADEDKFRLMMTNASRTVVALENNRVVGFARALCDEVSNGYIGTVIVAADFRKKGVGREMVKKLMGDDENITWVLRAGRESGEFWKKMGFAISEVAMEKTRK